MKRTVFIFLAVLAATMVVTAQRYDYDDIYFNPKVDLPKKTAVTQSQEVDVVETQNTVYVEEPSVSESSSMSYTDRINAFHRVTHEDNTASALERRLSDPNYTTNVFVLSDGQYLVDVDGGNITVNQNYNYPAVDWGGIYWTNPWYYGTSYYGWNWRFGWYWNWSWYDPWYNPYYGWAYNPWHNPYYGCYHHYNCHYWDYYYHHSHNHYGHHHNSYDWNDRYVRRTSENDRRRVHSENYRWAANVTPVRNSSPDRNVQSVSGFGGNGSTGTVSDPNVPRSSAVNRVSSVTGASVSEQSRNVGQVSNQMPARPSSSVSNRRIQSVGNNGEHNQTIVDHRVTDSRDRTSANKVTSYNGRVNGTERQDNTQHRASALPAKPVQRSSERVQPAGTSVNRSNTSTVNRTATSRSNTSNRSNNSTVNRSTTSRSTSVYNRGGSSSATRSSGGVSGGSRSAGGSSTPRRR